jgi:S-adenosylmethionine:tRNA ribosyltransferase-isomerase
MDPGPKNISIAGFDYDLPPGRIAQYPSPVRDQSKVLIYKDGDIREGIFGNLAEYLPPDSLLIFNETRVVHARLLFTKPGGSRIEIMCLEPHGEFQDPQLAFRQTGSSDWNCLVGNSKRWKTGSLALEEDVAGKRVSLRAERLHRYEATSEIRFSWSPQEASFAEILETLGKVPLPPYINRPAGSIDNDHYQTVYARLEGSVAAPTAGLHFTPELLQRLDDLGMQRISFTLHVGAGTFRPVVSEQIGSHEMHSEMVHLDLNELKRLYQCLSRPVVLVGTTSARLLESLYWHGVKLITGRTGGPLMEIRQWDPYEIGLDHGIGRKESLEKVIETVEASGQTGLLGRTGLIIAPGYRFNYPDMLITNFHQPKSTLLLLVAAFIGDDWKRAYEYALQHKFRFLSYGDSCIFHRKKALP